jgi:NAD+ kinase
MDRPMLLSRNVIVQVVPHTLADVALTVDGELMASLDSGDQVIVRASESISRFVRLRDRNYFYRSLLDRLEPRVPERPSKINSNDYMDKPK